MSIVIYVYQHPFLLVSGIKGREEGLTRDNCLSMIRLLKIQEDLVWNPVQICSQLNASVGI